MVAKTLIRSPTFSGVNSWPPVSVAILRRNVARRAAGPGPEADAIDRGLDRAGVLDHRVVVEALVVSPPSENTITDLRPGWSWMRSRE